MTPSLIAAFIWLITANMIALTPSKSGHWPAAYVLIAIGVPLVGWVTYQNGPWIGLVALAAGASVLRWPVRFFLRWLTRPFRKAEAEGE